MSDTSIPSPNDHSGITPPPPPAPPAAPPAPQASAQPQPQPTQAYPGAAPSYAPAPQGYAPPPPAAQVYGSQGAPGYPSYAPVRPTNSLAVTSLVCGLAGLLLSWLFVPMLASIAAVIAGHLALGQLKRNPGANGRGMAIAGLILGYVVVAILIITIVVSIFSFLFVGALGLPFLFSS